MNESKLNFIKAASAIGGFVIGWLLVAYCGLAILIPGAATIVLGALLIKIKIRPKYFLTAICLTGGHIIWFLVASAAAGNWRSATIDVGFLTVGIIFLWARPGFGSLCFLGGVQFVSLIVNISALISDPVGSLPYRALVAHCIFRLLVITCLILGYRHMRRQIAGNTKNPTVKGSPIRARVNG